MKHPIMKCTRWQSQLLIRLICMPAAMLFFFLSAHAQTDARLPPLGGNGGIQFVARCPQGQLLTGFELRVGDTVDAISPICVAAYGPNEIGPLQPYPSKFGGDGGHPLQIICPSDAPIVIKMDIAWAGRELFSVSYIGLSCGVASSTTQTPTKYPTVNAYTRFDDAAKRGGEAETCPPGLVAVGISGRAGQWLDALGLTCGPPKLTPKPVALGRVQPTSPPGPPMSICARARAARARNSPTAPALEAQCRAAGAAGEKTPPGPVSLGRGGPTSLPGPPISICARARAARARNSPTAPALEAQCRAAGAAGETVPPSAPTITAAPNPVMVPNGQPSGTTTITWKPGPDYTYCEIYLSVDNGEWSEFASGGDGSQAATIKLGSSYTFSMMVYEGQAGTPKIITTLTLTAKH